MTRLSVQPKPDIVIQLYVVRVGHLVVVGKPWETSCFDLQEVTGKSEAGNEGFYW